MAQRCPQCDFEALIGDTCFRCGYRDGRTLRTDPKDLERMIDPLLALRAILVDHIESEGDFVTVTDLGLEAAKSLVLTVERIPNGGRGYKFGLKHVNGRVYSPGDRDDE